MGSQHGDGHSGRQHAALEWFRMPGKVALITGAGKGIGAATAVALADAGADVALTARTVADLEAVATEVRNRGRRAVVLPADVSDLDGLGGLVERTVDELGGLDVLVNNAGGSVSRPFMSERVSHLENSFRFNVAAPFELTQRCVPAMLARGGGVVCNIGSVAGRNASRGTLVHSTTKAALAQLTRVMAADLAPHVRVNAVLPGAIETASLARYLDDMDPQIRATMIERTPMRRNGTPLDIALTVLWLVSPASSWVTGKLVEVDGAAAGDLIPKDLPDLEPSGPGA
ncbi:MAG: glucose 1-dehydrogenase [Acidimicrobiales bacterium]|nr:glucose 1-dehydrogenase [Acidimicrobiales bacterium]